MSYTRLSMNFQPKIAQPPRRWFLSAGLASLTGWYASGTILSVAIARESTSAVSTVQNLQATPPMTQPLTDEDGVSFKLDKLRGRPLLINFWASWCAPCRAEHENLMAIKKLGHKIIGVNYKDSHGKAEKFLQELGNPYYRIGSDENGEAAIAWGVYGIPETFLISPENKIIEKIAGPLTKSIYDNKLKKYLDP